MKECSSFWFVLIREEKDEMKKDSEKFAPVRQALGRADAPTFLRISNENIVIVVVGVPFMEHQTTLFIFASRGLGKKVAEGSFRREVRITE